MTRRRGHQPHARRRLHTIHAVHLMLLLLLLLLELLLLVVGRCELSGLRLQLLWLGWTL